MGLGIATVQPWLGPVHAVAWSPRCAYLEHCCPMFDVSCAARLVSVDALRSGGSAVQRLVCGLCALYDLLSTGLTTVVLSIV